MSSTASLTVNKRTLTVRDAVFGLLRELDLRTMFGNPGSTELAFLTPWPEDGIGRALSSREATETLS